MMSRFVASLIAVLVVWSSASVSAQSEGLELEHSPNGKRLLRLHAERVAELEAHFLESIEQPGERFAQACQRHIERYASLLEREMKSLTRAGKLDEAKAVQEAIRREESRAITPPDGEGMHFLSKADLEVAGNAKATKQGVDLLVHVERAAQLYNKQADRLFEQHKTKVESARASLRTEMAAILELEQRAGRLEAVEEVQAAIAALKDLPEVARPQRREQAEALDDDVNDEPVILQAESDIPDALHGFYTVRYSGADGRSREALLEIREKGCLVRSQAYYDEQRSIQWDGQQISAEVRNQTDVGMGLRFTDTFGQRVTMHFKYHTQRPYLVFDSRGNYALSQARGAGAVAGQTCYLRKLGYATSRQHNYADGAYVLAMNIKHDPEGQPREGVIKFKLEVIDGVLLITERSTLAEPDELEPCMPTVFRVRKQGGDTVLEAEYTLARQTEIFIQRTLRDGTKEMQLWWNRTNYQRGQTAAAFGTMTRAE